MISSNNFWWIILAVVGILNSVIALFYYVRIVREMYLRTTDEDIPRLPSSARRVMTGVFILVVPTVIFGIYWDPLRRLAEAVAKSLNLL